MALKKLFLLIALLSVFSAGAKKPTEYFDAGNPIRYCDTDFYFVYSEKPIDNYYFQEYLPKGETLEHYNQMFTVSVIFAEGSPLIAIQAKIAELEERKKTDPVVNYVALENNGEYLLDFIVSDSSDGELNTVEVDIHHYKQMKIGGKTATVLSFYSSRAYGDDIMPFIQSIPEKREEWYEGMEKVRIEPVFPAK